MDLFCTVQNGGFPRNGSILAHGVRGGFHPLGVAHDARCLRGNKLGGEGAIVKKLKRFQVERECK